MSFQNKLLKVHADQLEAFKVVSVVGEPPKAFKDSPVSLFTMNFHLLCIL